MRAIIAHSEEYISLYSSRSKLDEGTIFWSHSKTSFWDLWDFKHEMHYSGKEEIEAKELKDEGLPNHLRLFLRPQSWNIRFCLSALRRFFDLWHHNEFGLISGRMV